MKRDLAAVPWYTSSELYRAFMETALDRDDFFETFEEWRDVAMEHERLAELNGVFIFRVRMSYQDFETWCQSTGGLNNSAGRSAFAEERANMILDWNDPAQRCKPD